MPISTRRCQGAHFALYFNQGQCCCAGSRLFVEQKVYDEVIDRIAEKNKSTQDRRSVRPRDATRSAGRQGPVRQDSASTSNTASRTARSASPAASGTATKGYFVEPTLFANVTDDMRIAREEIFGPVMSVLKFKNVDEIIKRSNDTNFGLAAAVWTRDVAKAHRYAKEVRAGTVWVNCYDVFDAAAPFGGFKESGLGRELGEAGLDNYTESKTVTVSLT